MSCVLCDSQHENFRFIKETKYSFCVICKWPLKLGHVLVMPKRHVTQNEYSNLSPEETHDLFELVEEMQMILNKLSEEDIIVFKNSGKHSTESHFHFHIVPSQGNLRLFMSQFEGVPRRQDISEDEYREMQKSIIKKLS